MNEPVNQIALKLKVEICFIAVPAESKKKHVAIVERIPDCSKFASTIILSCHLLPTELFYIDPKQICRHIKKTKLIHLHVDTYKEMYFMKRHNLSKKIPLNFKLRSFKNPSVPMIITGCRVNNQDESFLFRLASPSWSLAATKGFPHPKPCKLSECWHENMNEHDRKQVEHSRTALPFLAFFQIWRCFKSFWNWSGLCTVWCS